MIRKARAILTMQCLSRIDTIRTHPEALVAKWAFALLDTKYDFTIQIMDEHEVILNLRRRIRVQAFDAPSAKFFLKLVQSEIEGLRMTTFQQKKRYG